MDWKTIELLGYTHYSQRGYRILIPLVSAEHFDFVAELDGSFLKVNVKMAGLKDNSDPNSWSIAVASGAGNKDINKVTCDVFLVWLSHKQKFIEISGEFFKDSRSKCRRLPKHLI